MKVTTALLCDFVQVREGLLFVSSGGITRLYRDQLPAPLGLHLALVIELDSVEQRRPHDLRVVIVDQDGREAGHADGQFVINSTDVYEPGESALIPVPLPLGPVEIKSYGAHDVKIYIDGNHHHTLTAWVKSRQSAAA